ncbi:hypothetical protein ACP70R_033822 [Stipagrostis hirtigluma subsp. patula]
MAGDYPERKYGDRTSYGVKSERGTLHRRARQAPASAPRWLLLLPREKRCQAVVGEVAVSGERWLGARSPRRLMVQGFETSSKGRERIALNFLRDNLASVQLEDRPDERRLRGAASMAFDTSTVYKMICFPGHETVNSFLCAVLQPSTHMSSVEDLAAVLSNKFGAWHPKNRNTLLLLLLWIIWKHRNAKFFDSINSP